MKKVFLTLVSLFVVCAGLMAKVPASVLQDELSVPTSEIHRASSGINSRALLAFIDREHTTFNLLYQGATLSIRSDLAEFSKTAAKLQGEVDAIRFAEAIDELTSDVSVSPEQAEAALAVLLAPRGSDAYLNALDYFEAGVERERDLYEAALQEEHYWFARWFFRLRDTIVDGLMYPLEKELYTLQKLRESGRKSYIKLEETYGENLHEHIDELSETVNQEILQLREDIRPTMKTYDYITAMYNTYRIAKAIEEMHERNK